MDHSDLVKDLAARYPFDRASIGSIFAFTARVAWELRGEGCGLLVKNAGENVYLHEGVNYSISRVCYPPGPDGQAQIYKILSDAGPGGKNGPQWVEDGFVEGNRYHEAIVVPGASQGPPVGIPDPGPLPGSHEELETAFSEFVVAVSQSFIAFDRELKQVQAAHEDLSQDLRKQLGELSQLVHNPLHYKGRTESSGQGFLKHSHAIDIEVTR